MLTKILAGVLVAVAVAGTGFYFATSEQHHCCPSRNSADLTIQPSTGECTSCCSMSAAVCDDAACTVPAPAATSGEEASCCEKGAPCCEKSAACCAESKAKEKVEGEAGK